jgi:octaheme c-type cytochrome (tetrathionate reductase family)
MRNIITFVLAVVIPLLIITLVLRDASPDNRQLAELRKKYTFDHLPGVDHSKHEILQRDFDNPHEITAACLSCHTERGHELLNSFHFTWEREDFSEGRGITYLGKKNLINNFCTGIFSNEGSCNRCHAGYGWSNNNFDFSNPYNIDCLVCHDNTGTYEKARGGAGYPDMNKDFRNIAQSVGRPQKSNCGYCHFHGGGGNNVKHGDLEMALLTASRDVDVHMAVDGANLECVDCHVTTNHQMAGRYYGVSSENSRRATCEQCHTATPHVNDMLNSHIVKVACQTCHIPQYAKVNATKMYWDWSTAGKRLDGQAFELLDSLGNPVYQSIKGDAIWQTNVVPEYAWFNGTADHFLLSDKIDTTAAFLKINTLFGKADDDNSRIVPMKVHRGRQPYDPVYLNILQAKLWDREPGKGALWVDLDWERALVEGMNYLQRPYSGQWKFVDTEMYLPVNHMVSPADQALTCGDCHTSDGRLAAITGTYIPGATSLAAIDLLGTLLIVISFAGVAVHATVRYYVHRRNKKENAEPIQA